MKTIPTPWKNGSTNRRDWYNNRGIPVFLVRLRHENGTIRLSNYAVTFHESSAIGYAKYDTRFLESMSDIHQELNFLQGEAGAIGQMSEATLILDAGYVKGVKFSDLYAIEDFQNALVDIWWVPKEVVDGDLDLTPADVSTCFTGVITNVSEDQTRIIIRCDEIGQIRHKVIPYSVKEYSDVNALGWDIITEDEAQPVPITFGLGYWKVQQVHVNSAGDRQVYAVVGSPKTQKMISFPPPVFVYPSITSLHYHNGKSYLPIPVETKADWWNYNPAKQVWSTVQLTGAVAANIKDLAALPKDIGNYQVLISAMGENFHGSAVNGEAIADNNVLSEHEDLLCLQPQDAPYILFNNLAADSAYHSIWRAYFDKRQFPAGRFNAYLLADCIYFNISGAETPKVDIKFLPNIASWSAPIIYPSDDNWNFFIDRVGNALFMGNLLCCARDFQRNEWLAPIPWAHIDIPSLHNIGCLDPTYRLKLDGTADVISETSGVNILVQMARSTGTAYTRSIQVHELGLLVVPLRLQAPIYAYCDMYCDNVKIGISKILEMAGWPYSSVYYDWAKFEHFLTDYKLDTQVNEFINSQDLIKRICQEFGFINFEDEDGNERVIDISPANSEYTITDHDVLKEKGVLVMEKTLSDKEIYGSFAVNYKRNIATGKYDAIKYVSRLFHNLVYVDAVTLKALCDYAYDYYGTERKLVIDLPDVRDDTTAEQILGKAVQFYSSKKMIVKFSTSLQMWDLEIGDQVILNTSFVASDYNFYIVSKYVNWRARRIEFMAMESPWTGAGLTEQLEEVVRLNETIEAQKLAVVAETEDIVEVAEAIIQAQVAEVEDLVESVETFLVDV